MSKQNRTTVRRITDEVFVAGQFGKLEELLAPNFVNHDPMPGTAGNKDGYRGAARAVHDAFSDMIIEDHKMVDQEDLVSEYWRVRCRHSGTFLGIEPTGKDVTIKGFELWRLANGKIAERWAVIDTAALWEQLGATPRLKNATLAD